MTALLVLLAFLMPSPEASIAYLTWDRLSWEYELPPLSLRVAEIGADGEQGLMGGFDAQGRAVVTITPEPTSLEKTVVHEAVHTLLRSRGIPYVGNDEETLANQFAYCWLGVPDYLPSKPCSEVIADLATFHR